MSHALTKSELIDHIAAECGYLNSKEAETAVKTCPERKRKRENQHRFPKIRVNPYFYAGDTFFLFVW